MHSQSPPLPKGRHIRDTAETLCISKMPANQVYLFYEEIQPSKQLILCTILFCWFFGIFPRKHLSTERTLHNSSIHKVHGVQRETINHVKCQPLESTSSPRCCRHVNEKPVRLRCRTPGNTTSLPTHTHPTPLTRIIPGASNMALLTTALSIANHAFQRKFKTFSETS